MTPRVLLRAALSLTCVLAALAGALVVSTATAPPARATANGADFRAGNIISDAVFWDANTMAAWEIQAFLDSKLSSCSAGYTCLKDYHQDTWSRPADAQCAAYPGVVNQAAADIIFNVAQACGVNPRVLLVLLQKESSLVTATAPTAKTYSKATGYACPDTAPCDAQYNGFYNQVYKAAWQYKRYAINWRNYSYQAGRYNTIQWNPDAACGSSQVYIENQATAGLYIYTPYQPNTPALTNLYGLGDSCSSYGNRNFWRLFTDWWGSTQFSVVGSINAVWQSTGGPDGPLGKPIGPMYTSVGGGWVQAFQGGRIHGSPATGMHTVLGYISAAYDAVNGEAGALGYPISEQYPTANNGWTQAFQNGRIHWSPATGAHAVIAPISATYDAMSGEAGALGYPVSDRYPTANSGWTQAFQNGRIHYSPATGAFAVLAPISPAYDALSGEAGALGYPVSNRYPTVNGGWTQPFQNGRIHYSPATGAFAVLAPISPAYDALSGEAGALGYPISNRYRTANNGWTQPFQNGRIHYSPATGAHAVIAPISAAYDALSGEAGPLGYPTAERTSAAGGGVVQQFANGRIYWSASTGAQAVRAPILSAYTSAGGEGGSLGYPTGPATVVGNATVQTFQHGSISWTSGGGAVVTRS